VGSLGDQILWLVLLGWEEGNKKFPSGGENQHGIVGKESGVEGGIADCENVLAATVGTGGEG